MYFFPRRYEDDLALLAIQQLEGNADRGAWIQPWSDLSGQPRFMHPSGVRKYSVAAEKLQFGLQ